jgi:hypothetical protein
MGLSEVVKRSASLPPRSVEFPDAGLQLIEVCGRCEMFRVPLFVSRQELASDPSQMTAQLHGQRREIEGSKFAKREQDHVLAPLVHVEPFGISPGMFVVGVSFGCVALRRCSAMAGQREGFVTRERSSGGTQTASLDDHNLSLSAWSRPWSFPTGLSSHHQHSASDFIVGQAAQLSGDLDLTLEPVGQTLGSRNSLVETGRIVARAPMAPRGRNGCLAVHRPSPTSSKETREKLICAMHNCRRLGLGWSQSGVLAGGA